MGSAEVFFSCVAASYQIQVTSSPPHLYWTQPQKLYLRRFAVGHLADGAPITSSTEHLTILRLLSVVLIL